MVKLKGILFLPLCWHGTITTFDVDHSAVLSRISLLVLSSLLLDTLPYNGFPIKCSGTYRPLNSWTSMIRLLG